MSQTYNQSMMYLRNLAVVIEKYLGSDLTETLEALNQGIGALKTLEDMYSKSKISASAYGSMVTDTVNENVSRETLIKSLRKYHCGDSDCKECPFSTPFGCLHSSILKHFALLEGSMKYE